MCVISRECVIILRKGYDASIMRIIEAAVVEWKRWQYRQW